MSLEPEQVLKGRIAECLVNELLRACHNKVYRFGYESVLQNLTQLEQTFQNNTETAEIIRSIPDFVVVNKEGKPFFIEVKFRTCKNSNFWFKNEFDKIKQILHYWNAILILVTTEKPYFRVYDESLFDQGKPDLIPLETYKDLGVEADKLIKFDEIVEKYYLRNDNAKQYLKFSESLKNNR